MIIKLVEKNNNQETENKPIEVLLTKIFGSLNNVQEFWNILLVVFKLTCWPKKFIKVLIFYIYSNHTI